VYRNGEEVTEGAARIGDEIVMSYDREHTPFVRFGDGTWRHDEYDRRLEADKLVPHNNDQGAHIDKTISLSRHEEEVRERKAGRGKVKFALQARGGSEGEEGRER
jgi:hypothetical protein